jgi:hypothetical protein
MHQSLSYVEAGMVVYAVPLLTWIGRELRNALGSNRRT